MKILKRITINLFRFAYFIPILATIIFLTVLFGHKILGPGLIGSDNSNFINLAKWISDWFPRIPFWYPQEGGGMSFTISYPILNHLIVVLFEKITKFPIAVSFRIWSLITVVLTSVGIYFMTFKLTKNQTVSSIASVIYPLCPITWIFMLGWGFAAEQLSYWLLPLILLFITLFLDEYYSIGLNKKAKIYLLISIITLALLSVGHSVLFIGIVMFVGILTLVYPGLVFKEKSIKKIFGLSIGVMVMTLTMSAFWIIPFFRYQSIAAKGSPVAKGSVNYELFMQTSVYAPNVFHLTDKTADYTALDDELIPLSPTTFRNVSFPFVVSILALIGLIGSFFINRKVFAFGISMVFPLAIAVFPQMTFYLLKFPFADYFFNWRAAIASSRFVMPLLAAFGCYSVAYLFLFPLKRFAKPVFYVLICILTLIVTILFFWKFKNWPQGPDFLISYGVDGNIPSSKLDIRNVWRNEVDKCFGGSSFTDVLPDEIEACKNYSLQKYFWTEKLKKACIEFPNEAVCNPRVKFGDVLAAVDRCNKKDLSFSVFCAARTKGIWEQVNPGALINFLKSKDIFNLGSDIFGDEKVIFDLLPDSPIARIDIGTSLGAFMMVEPFYSNVPELPVYYNQGTLIKNFWNYEISIMNMKDSVWPQDIIMREISKYFGLKYMLLSRDLVPIDKYIRSGWEKIGSWGQNEWAGLELWKNNDAVDILNASTKPTVLVIGQDKVDSYFRIFHLANLGVISFDNATLIKGGPFIDVYDEKELLKFDLIILEGYAYQSNNHKKGWNILDTYIKNGGSVLINTGWQYSSADWKVINTPDFFPLTSLDWIKTGTTNDYNVENSDISGEIDISKFSPLLYGTKEWNVSSSQKTNLRSWAKIIISANNIPLIAGGNYGSGKIIWMGLDLPGHISTFKDNEEEIKLYKNLVSYLLNNKVGEKINVEFSRNYPDRLEISINETKNKKTTIYLSEAYYPDFKAKLVEHGKSKKINSYKAGPGMTAFILPNINVGSKIVYQYKQPILVILAKTISFITFLGTLLIIVKPDLVSKLIIKLPKIKRKGIEEDEEDY